MKDFLTMMLMNNDSQWFLVLLISLLLWFSLHASFLCLFLQEMAFMTGSSLQTLTRMMPKTMTGESREGGETVLGFNDTLHGSLMPSSSVSVEGVEGGNSGGQRHHQSQTLPRRPPSFLLHQNQVNYLIFLFPPLVDQLLCCFCPFHPIFFLLSCCQFPSSPRERGRLRNSVTKKKKKKRITSCFISFLSSHQSSSSVFFLSFLSFFFVVCFKGGLGIDSFSKKKTIRLWIFLRVKRVPDFVWVSIQSLYVNRFAQRS